MKKFMIPILSAIALVAVTVSITLFVNARTNTNNGSVTVQAEDFPNQIEGTPTAEEAPADAELINLITISTPYDESRNDDVRYATLDDNKFLFLVSIKEYDISQNQITLPNTRVDIGADTVSMPSKQEMIIAYHFKFAVDSSIVWSENTDPNLTWDEHPEVVFPKAGQTAVVEYRSTDGGTTWIGNVNIFPSNG